MPHKGDNDMLSRSEHRSSPMLAALGFLPAALVVWVLYDLLMLILGGKNPAYGPGWNQWNYVRWMIAPDDAARLASADRILSFFLALPMIWETGVSGLIHRTERSTRRQWLQILGADLVIQSAGLLMTFSCRDAGSLFWWSRPRTVIPVPTVRLFEIATIVAWYVSPFLAYWLTESLKRVWKKRHGGPSGTVFGSTLDSRDGVEV